MEVDKIFGIFDSLVTPIALYGCEFWLPLILPKKTFSSNQNLLAFWKDFTCEKINQKCSRISLSVNRKTSRLAVLGELGRYPLFIKALSHCINYKLSLFGPTKQSSLVSDAIQEMREMSSSGVDCWLTRVKKIQTLLNIPDRPLFKRGQGKKTTCLVRGKFDRFWLDCINSKNNSDLISADQADHNKLRTYRVFKSSFTREPYLDLVRNRNQRSFITRLRTGSHHLHIETGRWTRPVTPVDQRTCSVCTPVSSGPGSQTHIDDEYHFLMSCPKFKNVREIAFQDVSLVSPEFANLSEKQQFCALLCPTQPKIAKITNQLVKQMFELREKINQNYS